MRLQQLWQRKTTRGAARNRDATLPVWTQRE